MRNILKMMKPWDIIIVVLLVILSFLPVAVFSYQNMASEASTLNAVISVDGETIKTMELHDDGKTETFEYSDEHGHQNIVVREGTTVYMIEASCSDQLCVRQGEITEVGETIVCLPHRFMVEISSDNPDINQDIDIDAVT